MTLADLVAVIALASMAGGETEAPPAARADVVFVCAKGNVKSLIASEWFNRLAFERGLATRSVARGLAPENPVPEPIVSKLRGDGIDVAGFEARALVPDDLGRASRLVLIGVKPPSWVARSGVTAEPWEGIPPTSESYEASRDAMRRRIEALLAGAPKAERPR